MVTIVEFLKARLDEATADAVKAGGDRWILDGGIHRESHPTHEVVDWVYDEADEHIARNDPAHVLADIAAKRAIVEAHAPSGNECRTCCGEPYMEEYWNRPTQTETVEWKRADLPFPCPTIRILTSVYSDHPDYRSEWKP